MKIGIWLGWEVADTAGGGASYVSKFLNLVDNYHFSSGIEICYLSFVPQPNLKREVINVSQLPKVFYKIFENYENFNRKLKKLDLLFFKRKGFANALRYTQVKVIYYHSQNICEDSTFPFISTNWDIGHRSTHSFPELVYRSSQFEVRDDFYMKILPKALMILCESETGKKELIDYTGLGEHKIRVLPIFAGNVNKLDVPYNEMSNILQKLELQKDKYFYYPAQFWAHKNHIGLIKAFHDFCQEYKGYKLVLSGSDHGNLNYIKSKCEEYGLSEKVLFLGFVPNETVFTLYKNATSLVMASHFGPTNMPPIEAMELGCPVACSDIGGHREILGDSAIYFNSFDYHSICNAMIEMVKNRSTFVEKIERQKAITQFNDKNAMASLNKILEEVVVIRENWE